MAELLQLWAPLAISVLSLIVASIALGWNVYRDVVLKARVKVSVSVVQVLGDRAHLGSDPSFIRVGVTNHGPGTVIAQMIIGQQAGLWRRLMRRTQYFVVMADHTNPLNPKLPAKLEVADTISLLLPYNEKSFLNGACTHIGVRDSFGRDHYAPQKQLVAAKEQLRKDFPSDVARPQV